MSIVPPGGSQFVGDNLAALAARLLASGRVEGLHGGVLQSNLFPSELSKGCVRTVM